MSDTVERWQQIAPALYARCMELVLRGQEGGAWDAFSTTMQATFHTAPIEVYFHENMDSMAQVVIGKTVNWHLAVSTEHKTFVSITLFHVNEHSFSPAEQALFHALTPFIQLLISRYWRAKYAHNKPVPSPSMLSCVMEESLDDFLTRFVSAREREILRLLLDGLSIKAIARALGIAPNTVRNHMQAAYRKLDISSQGELFARLWRHVKENPPQKNHSKEEPQ